MCSSSGERGIGMEVRRLRGVVVRGVGVVVTVIAEVEV